MVMNQAITILTVFLVFNQISCFRKVNIFDLINQDKNKESRIKPEDFLTNIAKNGGSVLKIFMKNLELSSILLKNHQQDKNRTMRTVMKHIFRSNSRKAIKKYNLRI